MCGIVGFIDINKGSATVEVATRMAAAIAHRGPDDHGAWAEDGVAFGHRRLSIVDLTPEGHQPKASHSGRFMITFNGEIYNFHELKEELLKRGHTFRGTGDTEMMLQAFEEWGVEESLKKFVGMFAFGVWDRKEKVLTLARDRFGEKPLYYGWSNGVFMFSSEPKAFKAHPAFKSEINRDALTQVLRHGYIPAPHSIYRGFFKLTQATLLRLSLADAAGPKDSFSEFPEGDAKLRPSYYWSLHDIASAPNYRSFHGSDEEALNELDRILSDSVKHQMVSDVPLGAFLSGGIDSSTIVALMQKQSTRPIRTFSIGFEQKEYNEALFAKQVAKHIGTDHTELYVTAKETLDVVPRIPQMYCEPFADSSQIPTYLVSKMARQHVTVSLSGDAGDELFCGYPRYIWSNKLWNYIGRVPHFLRAAGNSVAQSLPASTWNTIFSVAKPVMPKGLSFTGLGYKFQRAAAKLSAASDKDLYFELLSMWEQPASVVLNSKEPLTGHRDSKIWPSPLNYHEWMMWVDTATYLPDDILVKVDRAAMAVSLETRVPLLDHRVAEFVWTLPPSMRLRGNTSKWLLRQLLYKYVPKEMVERPKMGFGAPINAWLRGPLKEWAEALLDEKRLKDEGYFDPAPIRKKWAEHLSGTRDWQYPLWHVLTFQAWLEAQR